MVSFDDLSEREEQAVRWSAMPLTPAEGRDLLDFLGYPDALPRRDTGDCTLAVVRRILSARSRGEHIA